MVCPGACDFLVPHSGVSGPACCSCGALLFTCAGLCCEQGRARPSLAELYNWRYRHLGNLPNVLTQPAFLRANPGFAYDYQFVDVPDYQVACSEPLSTASTWLVFANSQPATDLTTGMPSTLQRVLQAATSARPAQSLRVTKRPMRQLSIQ